MNRRQRRLAGKKGKGTSGDDALALALAHEQAGDFAAAEQAYRDLIQRFPRLHRARLHLAVLADRAGRSEEAYGVLQDARGASSPDGDILNVLGIVCRKTGRIDEAIRCYERAIKLDAEAPGPRLNLGLLLMGQGGTDAAIAQYRAALAIDGGFAEAHNNLANALVAQGEPTDAETHYEKALALKPDYAEAHNNLASLLQEKGRIDDALVHFGRALEIRPDYADAAFNTANAHQAARRPAMAETFFRQALAMEPDHAEALGNLGNALKDQGRIKAAMDCYARALALDGSAHRVHSNLLFGLLYPAAGRPHAIFAEHRHWAEKHATAPAATHAPGVDAEKVLRVGYVSPDFRRHSVASFIAPVLAAHDPGRVRTIAYSNVAKPDATTERLRDLAHDWRDIVGEGDVSVARRIAEDGIDILVDLAGHTANNRLLLFARRPAPVQVTYLGYPCTTGLTAIDYRLSDAIADPPGDAEGLHAERLMRLENGFLCYEPPEDAPFVAPLPALAAGSVTFASFNMLAKVTDEVIALWSEILAALPDSRMILKERAFSEAAPREAFRARFAAHGIDEERLECLPATRDLAGHLALYERADIALDTFPYNGTTTTCEALWMGVPVITLAADRHAGRVGASLLERLGRSQWVASEASEYVEKAVALARDRAALAIIRAGLRDAMTASPLTDASAFTAGLEAAYREMWRAQCGL